ncbi:MAG: hypothetical protein GY768_00030 [Planctomycetaceae bacterium]|nr:hypothetical protein [Planctomycetaceae bacterium]
MRIFQDLALITELSLNLSKLGVGVAAFLLIVFAIGTYSVHRTARYRSMGIYGAAWGLLMLAQLFRNALPMRFYIWSGLAEWSGFLLAAAIVGWLARRRRLSLDPEAGFHNRWFMITQAIGMGVVASLIGWVATDFGFDGMGVGFALLGLSGRACACPSALMLVGASIVMAWQSTGFWRAAWQFTAMAAGILFTTTVGWAGIQFSAVDVWLGRRTSLMISTGMMTMMTWIGLPRILPTGSDWIRRGRQVAPLFAATALLLLAAILLPKIWLSL